MKSCTYCGRENEDGITFCQGCGTEIVAAAAEQPPRKPLDWTGLKYTVLAVGAFSVVAVLYLLSFGPVSRWTATRAAPVPPLIVTNGTTTTFTATYTITYPAWVGVVYYPAFELLSSSEATVAGLYQRYVHWWEKPPPP